MEFTVLYIAIQFFSESIITNKTEENWSETNLIATSGEEKHERGSEVDGEKNEKIQSKSIWILEEII